MPHGSPIPADKIEDCPLAERQWAANTIASVPLSGAFDAAARQWLIDRAHEGYEVDAYQPANGGNEWVLWIRTANPADEMRWEPHEWAIAWRALTQTTPGPGETVAALSIGPAFALALVPAAWHTSPVPAVVTALFFVLYAAAVIVWRPWRAHAKRKVAR